MCWKQNVAIRMKKAWRRSRNEEKNQQTKEIKTRQFVVSRRKDLLVVEETRLEVRRQKCSFEITGTGMD